MSTTGSTAWAGQEIPLVGPSVINTMSVNLGPNNPGVSTQIAVFGMFGSFYDNEPLYTQDITLQDGWNEFDVNLDVNNSFIVAMQFTNVDSTEGGVYGPLDESATPSTNSRILFPGGSWDNWGDQGVADGEWGIRANITYQGANATYNVYRDGNQIANGLSVNSFSDDGLENNITYSYQLSATYSSGDESDLSDAVEATPQSNTVYELSYDDGSAEAGVNAGSGDFMAVKFTSNGSDQNAVRAKWYQMEEGGAFYLKIFEILFNIFTSQIVIIRSKTLSILTTSSLVSLKSSSVFKSNTFLCKPCIRLQKDSIWSTEQSSPEMRIRGQTRSLMWVAVEGWIPDGLSRRLSHQEIV